jgi:2-keto-3-deoxy-L-rhamnonate aldolase RhmA
LAGLLAFGLSGCDDTAKTDSATSGDAQCTECPTCPSVEGVDGVFIGPGDLGLRIKHHSGDLTLDGTVEHVAAVCRKHGKAWGLPVTSAEELQQRRAQGGQLLNYGGEFGAIMNMLKSCAAAFDTDAEKA